MRNGNPHYIAKVFLQFKAGLIFYFQTYAFLISPQTGIVIDFFPKSICELIGIETIVIPILTEGMCPLLTCRRIVPSSSCKRSATSRMLRTCLMVRSCFAMVMAKQNKPGERFMHKMYFSLCQ